MTLRVHNTLTKQKEPFEPINGKRVGMYVCGPTVYDHCHIGHARSYVAFDVIRRYLEHEGYLVSYVQNFTDVDDKIINRAAERGMEPLELSKMFIDSYFEDMEKLNVMKATHHPLASELVPEMVQFIEQLIAKDHAYVAKDGSVYFSVESAADIFGQLTHQKLEDMLDGARVEVDQTKRSPKDFALWKAAKEGEISWESPWGPGRPGWHIECSTMANIYIGSQLDIHGGGMDLIFPHHESEILQSECIHNASFSKYWLHNGFINVNSEKMSKSLNNFFTIKDVLKEFKPMVVRFFLIYTHYRREVDYSKDALVEAQTAYQRLTTFRRKLAGYLKEQGQQAEPVKEEKTLAKLRAAFMEQMDDDFNTRGAVAQLFELVSQGNRLLDKAAAKVAEAGDSEQPPLLAGYLTLFDELTEILGLQFQEGGAKGAEGELLDNVMTLLLELRQKARENKDWATSDQIRDRLRELGVTVEDKAGKSSWHTQE